MKALNYIDLFAGAGGLSEGFKKAGYNPVAHIEMDANACKTIKTRVAFHYLSEIGKLDVYNKYVTRKITETEFFSNIPSSLLDSVMNEEISDANIKSIFSRIEKRLSGKKVDLIIGGPPCQVYSLVGRSRIGKENVSGDKRYFLYKQYAEFLKKFKPKIFVFENVQGLLSAEDGQLIKNIEKFLEKCGYRIKYQLLNAAEYGVLQHRKRVILIGKRGKTDFEYPEFEKVSQSWSVKEALFSDLKPLKPGDEFHVSEYTSKKVNDYLKKYELRNGVNFVTQHITRPHNERDLEIYRIAIIKWLQKKERLKYNDLPKKLKTHNNQSSFLDRFKVVDPNGLSHTVVAHICKDGHHFIYPDTKQIRSISVREAARIQSFPDDYFFEGGRSAAFRQIGNAVPPVLAYCVAKTIKDLL